MKSHFSKHWKSSRQVRKQRKYQYNAPLHVKHKFLSSNLSKALREKYSKRSLPLRKGDEVLVMRGTFSKKKGKIVSVNLKQAKVAIEGLQRQKKDGTKVNVFFHPSVLQIHSLNLDDKYRVQALTRKSSSKAESQSKETVK